MYRPTNYSFTPGSSRATCSHLSSLNSHLNAIFKAFEAIVAAKARHAQEAGSKTKRARESTSASRATHASRAYEVGFRGGGDGEGSDVCKTCKKTEEDHTWKEDGWEGTTYDGLCEACYTRNLRARKRSKRG